MRVLVTGSRHWTDRRAVMRELFNLYVETRVGTPFVVVHGDCPTGADAFARRFCRNEGAWHSAPTPLDVVEEAHPADWDKHGKAAGPMRNQEMVDLGADICLAFLTAESRGTRDCMKRATKAGIQVKVITGGDEGSVRDVVRGSAHGSVDEVG